MSGFFGLISRQRKQFNGENKLLYALSKRGLNVKKVCYENGYMFNSSNFNSHIYVNNNIYVNFNGVIDNFNELCSKCNISLPNKDYAQLIYILFLKFKESFISDLEGIFGFCIYDRYKDFILCSRDGMGQIPFYYIHDKDNFAFASEPKFLIDELRLDKALNEKKVLGHVIQANEDINETYFKNVFRVNKGELLILQNNKVVKNHKFHQFEFNDYENYKNDNECYEDFRNIFTKTIKRMTDGHEKIGTTLSGGLDSSSVARVLANEKSDKEIYSYTFTFPGLKNKDFKGTNEKGYAQDAINLGGLNSRILGIERHNVFEKLLEDQYKYPEPCTHANRYQEHALIDACISDNVKILLTGFDGDCTISYGRDKLNKYIGDGKYKAALQEHVQMKKNMGKNANYLKSFYQLIFLRYAPEKLIQIYWNARNKNKRNIYKNILSKNIYGKFHEGNDIESMKKTYDYKISHVELMNSYRFQRIFEMTDIDYTNSGILERHPFCDRKLIEFCLRVPLELKMKNGITRYFLRQSMRGILPDSIIQRISKSNLSPYYMYSIDESLPRIIDQILNTQSIIGQLIERKSLKSMINNHNLLNSEEKTFLSFLAITDAWIMQNF